ncbi:hypothetical protein FLT15_08720 [Paenibacillus thiaminolyticus]|uniref:hypothetical protein n=1 Tax=Paenibacillus thiaminolyticus TaxID=49283 RepID=UPI001163A1F5|nr:hypothetical protein [Paenibacillus thiaminolyticus]NGP58472.1 hypothetical protein [Paenibacillus thiaminolyticus]
MRCFSASRADPAGGTARRRAAEQSEGKRRNGPKASGGTERGQRRDGPKASCGTVARGWES